MLTLLGFGMVITFMTLIMLRLVSPLVALIAIPVVFALLAGVGGGELGEMMLDGIRTPIIDDSVAVWDLILAAANSCAGERDRFPSEVDRIAKRRGMKVDVRLVVKCVDETLTLHAVYNTRDDMDRQRVAKSFTPAWLAYKRAWL